MAGTAPGPAPIGVTVAESTYVFRALRIRVSQFLAQGYTGFERRESLGKSLLASMKPADRQVACRQLGPRPGVGRLGLGPLLADRERLMLRLERVRGLPRPRQDIADVAVDIGQ